MAMKLEFQQLFFATLKLVHCLCRPTTCHKILNSSNLGRFQSIKPPKWKIYPTPTTPTTNPPPKKPKSPQQKKQRKFIRTQHSSVPTPVAWDTSSTQMCKAGGFVAKVPQPHLAERIGAAMTAMVAGVCEPYKWHHVDGVWLIIPWNTRYKGSICIRYNPVTSRRNFQEMANDKHYDMAWHSQKFGH